MLCVTEAKLVWMMVFARIQRRLYAVGAIPGNMWGFVLGRSTQEASFLYDMYLDNEDLEAFMESVDVKGVFCNTLQTQRGALEGIGVRRLRRGVPTH